VTQPIDLWFTKRLTAQKRSGRERAVSTSSPVHADGSGGGVVVAVSEAQVDGQIVALHDRRGASKQLVTHDSTEKCVICRAQDIAAETVVPAVMVCEDAAGHRRFSMALHGAAGLLLALIGLVRLCVEQEAIAQSPRRRRTFLCGL
jgi:hypothetical protein